MQPEVAMKTETYEVQIGKLLEQLTLEEKIGMIHGAGLFRTEGVERLSIPPLFFSDGPMPLLRRKRHGRVRHQST